MKRKIFTLATSLGLIFSGGILYNVGIQLPVQANIFTKLRNAARHIDDIPVAAANVQRGRIVNAASRNVRFTCKHLSYGEYEIWQVLKNGKSRLLDAISLSTNSQSENLLAPVGTHRIRVRSRNPMKPGTGPVEDDFYLTIPER